MMFKCHGMLANDTIRNYARVRALTAKLEGGEQSIADRGCGSRSDTYAEIGISR